MPKYVLPKPKKKDKEVDVAVEAYPRYIYVPANAEMAKAAEIGKAVELMLVGTVRGIEQREGHSEISVELKSVEMPYGDNEFEEMARGDE